MTLPFERTGAVLATRDFLLALLHKDIKRVPANVRTMAGNLLRHFPNEFDLKEAAKDAPEVFEWRSDAPV